MSSKKAPSKGPSRAKYEVYQSAEFWIAHDKIDALSGFIVYDKRSGIYRAGLSHFQIHFPQLGQGGWTSIECPLDDAGRPKADFLMLIALRESLSDESPWRHFQSRHWRELFFRKKVDERLDPAPLSEENWGRALEIAGSGKEFERYVGDYLVSVLHNDDAAEVFSRIGCWLEKIKQLEDRGMPSNYRDFFEAVERAAAAAQGVPAQKAVREIYESSQSRKASQFRTTMRQLKFDWLPPGGRGPARIQKKSGIK